MRKIAILVISAVGLTGCAGNTNNLKEELAVKANKQAAFTCEYQMKLKPGTSSFEDCKKSASELELDKKIAEHNRDVDAENLSYSANLAAMGAMKPRSCYPMGNSVQCF